MADAAGLTLDRVQVKKAVQALQAFLKTKSSSDSVLLDDVQHVSLLFTLWRIPKKAQTIRIPLPHAQRSDTDDVCLFTRDEPNMTSDQTQRFYRKLLEERGVKNITEIIPYKVLKTEYKPYEAKRRLLGNFDVFLSDERVRRLLPSHLGKHFYERKREPLTVNLQSKHLARDVERLVNGTRIKVTNRGCCCMTRVAQASMTADQVTENIEAAVQTVVSKLRMKGPVVKLIHIKSETSVALPVYTSDLNHLKQLEEQEQEQALKKEKAAAKRAAKQKKTENTETPGQVEEEKEEEKKEEEEEEKKEEEEIPQLVPIATPSKKRKVEKPSRKQQLEVLPESELPAAKKKTTNKKNLKSANAKVKRKVPKVK